MYYLQSLCECQTESTFTDNIISVGSSYSFNQLVYIRDLGIIMLFSHYSILRHYFILSFKCLVMDVNLHLFSQFAFLSRLFSDCIPEQRNQIETRFDDQQSRHRWCRMQQQFSKAIYTILIFFTVSNVMFTCTNSSSSYSFSINTLLCYL